MLRDPIFVVGPPRSGTTLLQCILSANSYTFSLPETHFFSIVLPQSGKAPRDVIGTHDLLRIITELEKWAELRLSPSELERLVRCAEQGNLVALDLFEALVENHRPATDVLGNLRAIEKTPFHILHLNEIGASFPTAKMLCIIRHPVNAISSWYSSPFADSEIMISYTERWNAQVLAAWSYRERYPDRLLLIRYEDLVRNVEVVVDDLCHFLHIPFESKMLTDFGSELQKNSTRREVWKQAVATGTITISDDAWQHRISCEQAWLIERATSNTRTLLNYGLLTNATTIEKTKAFVQTLIDTQRTHFGYRRVFRALLQKSSIRDD